MLDLAIALGCGKRTLIITSFSHHKYDPGQPAGAQEAISQAVALDPKMPQAGHCTDRFSWMRETPAAVQQLLAGAGFSRHSIARMISCARPTQDGRE